ncbi:hypothetical protein [Xanthobacter sp.]|uniref:hypothetical protein n=1 Tax=Xanthobacter sp. TaxID=35809 RepID=UPI0025D24989|nr:hypothetical protein [Xanthobacter sp.]
MPRSPARFTQADIARALRAVLKARAKAFIEVLLDGTIRITPLGAEAGESPPPAEPEREIIL